MGKISQKPYLTDYNLLMVQDLWQAHYKILLLILLKEFEKLNVNTNMITKNLKIVELNTKFVNVQYTNFKDEFIEYKCLFCNKNYQKQV